MPKAFISYSWTSPGHQERVRQWAEQLISDGVDIVLDVYDLKEGYDKYAFMERMVTDETVTHVLVFSDREYTQKADMRQAGVGTESQIISREVYEKVEQSKFIPIVCEFDENGEPFLPTFLKSRMWIDFSTLERMNDNWEKLVRLLYGKPAHEKPTLGKPPVYIGNDSTTPASPAIAKFNPLHQAILQGKRGVRLYRRDFIDACINYADTLRVRQRPDVDSLGERVLEDCSKLKVVRNHIIDWVLLESEVGNTDDFTEALLLLLERMLELKSRPHELRAWNDAWFEAHTVFVYETFLYIVAALIKTTSFDVLHEVLTSHYLVPEASADSRGRFVNFSAFCGHSDTLQAVLAREGTRYHSAAAELIKRQADRSDLSFEAVIEAELLVLLMAFITPDTRWHPQTLYYAGYSKTFPLFLRATQHKHFQKIAIVTGIEEADALRKAVREGQDWLGVRQWSPFWLSGVSFWAFLNMDNLDTLR